MTSPTRTPRPRQRSDAEQVLQVLSDFCQALQPSDVVPTYQELMRQFGASERAMRWASASTPQANVETRTVIAIPDFGLFDQAMMLLVEQAKVEDVSVMCHMLPAEINDVAVLPQVAQEPLERSPA